MVCNSSERNGGKKDEQTCIGDHGGRNGEPLWRIEADGPG